MSNQFSSIQNEIYFGGGASDLPISDDGREQAARKVLSPAAYDYVAGGAGREQTMSANRAAFARWSIVPRVMRDVSQRDYRRQLFGRQLAAPIALAPVGQLGAVHDDAEVACGRAAAALGLPIVLSTVASKSIEQVADAVGDGIRWFQLYWPNDLELAKSFLSRAERSGYDAILVTLDTRLLGWRERDLQRAHLPFLDGIGLANYFSDPVFRARLARPPEEDLASAIGEFAMIWPYTSWTWQNLAQLREATSLPIVVKGILHPDDARDAVQSGVDGIVVSNHGGRQVDGAISSLEALPGVVDAVAGAVPILFDSGIRSGSDIVKALALGAATVLIGRPYVWGLALQGEAGVRRVLQYLLAEFDLTMALAGHPNLASLHRDALHARP